MSERTDHDHPVDRQRVAQARTETPEAAEAERLADLVKLVAEPTRARILCALYAVEELCVGDVALALDVSEDAVSYGLRVLRRAGLVRSRRDGRMAFYSLADPDTAPSLRRALDDLLDLTDSMA